MKLIPILCLTTLISSLSTAQAPTNTDWKNLDLESSSIVHNNLSVDEIKGLTIKGITFFHKIVPNTVVCQKSVISHKPVNTYSCSINIKATKENLSYFYAHLLVNEIFIDHQEFADYSFDVTQKTAGLFAINRSLHDFFKRQTSLEHFTLEFNNKPDLAIKRARSLITQDDLENSN